MRLRYLSKSILLFYFFSLPLQSARIISICGKLLTADSVFDAGESHKPIVEYLLEDLDIPKPYTPKKSPVPSHQGLELTWVATGEAPHGTYAAYGKSRYGNIMIYAREGLIMLNIENGNPSESKRGFILDSQSLINLEMDFKFKAIVIAPNPIKIQAQFGGEISAFPKISINYELKKNQKPLSVIKKALDTLFDEVPRSYNYPPPDATEPP